LEFLILNNKISPDLKQPKIISRPSLVKSLIANSDKSLICLSAGAGYGKTTLVNEFLSSAKSNFSWYKIDESDNNLILFFSYLIHSIKYRNKSFGHSSLEILNSLKSRINYKSDIQSIITTLSGTFLNELSNKVLKNFYIVLDDFHLLPKDEWLTITMLYLLENLPRNLHFVITTREKLPFDLATLKAKRKYFEIKTTDLKFKEEEIRLLSDDIYNIELSGEEIKIICDKFDGWVTGLHLFLQSKGMINLGNLDFKLSKNLYDFFAEDIFKSKNERIQSFLINTCMLEDFTPSTCNYLMHISNSEAILEELFNGNVFIKRQETLKDNNKVFSYSYQDLFKEFLLSKFSESKTGEEKKQHYKKIAEYYVYTDRGVKAVRFFLMAGEFKKSIDLILENISSVLKMGDLSLVNYWFDRIPGEMKSKNPYILYYLGCISKGYYGNLEEALTYFRSTLNYLKPADKHFFIKTNTHIAEILVILGKVNEAKIIYRNFLKKSWMMNQELIYCTGLL
jgi:LuxR family transcriptional regulator, maltose regulon positive regulatory protein